MATDIRPMLRLLAAFFACFSITLQAQEATGSITGRVLDGSGGAIPQAAIEVRNVRTNIVRTTESDTRGAFTAPALQPGLYEMSVQRAGFRKAIYSDIELQVNQVASVSAILEVGAVAETITITGGASLLQLESTTVGHVVETRKIEELPLNGRQFLQLTTLVPGTVSGYSRDASRQGGRRAGLNIAVSGGRTEFNNYLLDGVLNTDENFGTYVISPSVDALQEFKVQTSSYSAQYGRGGGARRRLISLPSPARINTMVRRSSSCAMPNWTPRTSSTGRIFRSRRLSRTSSASLLGDRFGSLVSTREPTGHSSFSTMRDFGSARPKRSFPQFRPRRKGVEISPVGCPSSILRPFGPTPAVPRLSCATRFRVTAFPENAWTPLPRFS